MILLEAWAKEADDRKLEELKLRTVRGEQDAFEQLAREVSRLGKKLPVLDVPWKWYIPHKNLWPVLVTQKVEEQWERDIDPADGSFETENSYDRREPLYDTRPPGVAERLPAILVDLLDLYRTSHGSSDHFVQGDHFPLAWQFWSEEEYDYAVYREKFTEYAVPSLSKEELSVIAKWVRSF